MPELVLWPSNPAAETLSVIPSIHRPRCRRIAVLTWLAAGGCATASPGGPNLDATLWIQTSVEYGGVTRSIYEAALGDLTGVLADSSWSAAVEQTGDYARLPPAVILDVDETVLDNSPYQARLILSRSRYTRQSWSAWVREAAAEAVPGAVAFTNAAAALGITVFFVTNRDAEFEEFTRRNLEVEGFPLRPDVDVVLMRGERSDWTRDKSSRRRLVAAGYRILMLFGDDLNDFVAVDRRSRGDREDIASLHEEYWGSRWRALPNPTYGSWEDTLYGFDYDLDEETRTHRKAEQLDPRN